MEHLSSTETDLVDPAVEADQVDPTTGTNQADPVEGAVEARPLAVKIADSKQRVVMYTPST